MRAMGVAAKVSVRVDEQGVLSLQFMIEVDQNKVSFVDFRFVPLADEEEGDDGEVEEDEEDEEDDSGDRFARDIGGETMDDDRV